LYVRWNEVLETRQTTNWFAGEIQGKLWRIAFCGTSKRDIIFLLTVLLPEKRATCLVFILYRSYKLMKNLLEYASWI